MGAVLLQMQTSWLSNSKLQWQRESVTYLRKISGVGVRVIAVHHGLLSSRSLSNEACDATLAVSHP